MTQDVFTVFDFFSFSLSFWMINEIFLETIVIKHGVTLLELREIILRGELMMPALQTTIMALNHLRKLALITETF